MKTVRAKRSTRSRRGNEVDSVPSRSKQRQLEPLRARKNAASASSSVVKLGLLQSRCSEDPAENLKKTVALAEQAAKKGAQIICTQELFRSQYFCQTEDHANFKLAESIPGPTTEAFQKIARKHSAVIIASVFEKRGSGVYHNTAAVIDADGSLLGISRKMQI